MAKVIKKAKSFWDGLSQGTQKLASLITSLIVVSSACIGACHYVVNQFDLRIEEKAVILRTELEDVKMSTTRNELMTLINATPDNVLEIEKVAKKYFMELHGDWYMSGFYSNWAKKHGGDTSFVFH